MHTLDWTLELDACARLVVVLPAAGATPADSKSWALQLWTSLASLEAGAGMGAGHPRPDSSAPQALCVCRAVTHLTRCQLCASARRGPSRACGVTVSSDIGGADRPHTTVHAHRTADHPSWTEDHPAVAGRLCAAGCRVDTVALQTHSTAAEEKRTEEKWT